MSFSDPRPRVAVIGGRGVGRFHAGLYGRLGAEVVGVCCSGPESAVACVTELRRDFGLDVAPYHRLEDVLDLGLDGVSLCTPPDRHYEQILACLDRGVAVFCEKPMFWNDGDAPEAVARKLGELRRHPARRLFVNTSNVAFLDAVLAGGPAAFPSRFDFSFHTQGPYTGAGIGLDLLPHALSLVLRLYGGRVMENLRVEVEERRYSCSFDYGDAEVHFDLREDPDGQKALSFALDGREYRRVQQGFGPSYRVGLETVDGCRVEVEDPFRVFLKEFLAYIREGAPLGRDRFDLDAVNLELMARMLSGPNT